MINKEKIKNSNIYPLSFGQRKALFYHELNSGSSINIMRAEGQMMFDVDVDLFRRAICELLEENEILRSNIIYFKDEVFQRFREDFEIDLRVYDISEDDTVSAESIIKGFYNEFFNLEEDILFRVCLVKKSKLENVFAFVFHHFVCDAESSMLFAMEVFDKCRLLHGEDLELDNEEVVQYGEYIEMEMALLNDPDNKQGNFWHNKLDKNLPVLNLPTDYGRSSSSDFEFGIKELDLGDELSNEINCFCNDNGVPVFVFFSALISLFLCRVCGNREVVLGTSASTRGNNRFAGAKGPYSDMKPLFAEFSLGASFLDILQMMKIEVLEMMENSSFPLDKTIKDLGIKKDKGRSLVVDVLFHFLTQKKLTKKGLYGVEILSIDKFINDEVSHHDLNFYCVNVDGGFKMILNYNLKLYKAESAEGFLGNLIELVKGAMESPDSPIDSLNLLSQYSKYKILYTFNNDFAKKEREDVFIKLGLDSSLDCFILNKSYSLQPVGVWGDLYVECDEGLDFFDKKIINTSIVVKFLSDGILVVKEKEVDDAAFVVIGDEKGFKLVDKIIEKVWKDVLGVSNVERNDDFFEIGGDSLKAMEFVVKLRQKNINIDLKAFLIDPRFCCANEIALHVENDKQNRGGIPFTAAGDWYIQQNKNKEIKDNVVLLKQGSVDFSILLEAIVKAFDLNSDIKINYIDFSKKMDSEKIVVDDNFSLNDKVWDLSKMSGDEINEISKDIYERLIACSEASEIGFTVVKTFFGTCFYFSRNKPSVSVNRFVSFLFEFQNIYNSILIGNEYKRGKKRYSPKCFYPNYYPCVHAGLMERVIHETGVFLPKSLLPALDYFVLPNYCVLDKKRRMCLSYVGERLGQNTVRDWAFELGIDEKMVRLPNKKRAHSWFNESTNEGQAVLLQSDLSYSPGSKYYLSEKSVERMSNEYFLELLNFDIFSKNDNGVITYSTSQNYFGQIDDDDFEKSWNCEDLKLIGLSINNKKEIDSYAYWRAEGLDGARSVGEKLLFEALQKNVDEFFASKKNVGGEEFERVYFGKGALLIFLSELEDGSIFDVVIIDMLRKMEIAALFLRDLIEDVCVYDFSFRDIAGDIIGFVISFEELNNKVSRYLHKNKIKFVPDFTILPHESLYDRKILDSEMKKAIIKEVRDIFSLYIGAYSNIQDKINK